MTSDIFSTVWHFWHLRKRSPLLLYIFFLGPKHDSKHRYIYTNGSVLDHIITKKQELENMQNNIWNKLKKEPDVILSFITKVYGEHKQLSNYLKTIAKKQYQNLNNKTLADEYIKTINYIHNVFEKTVYIPLCIEPLLEQETKNILKEQQNSEDIFNIVMTPIKQGIFTFERISLLKIAKLSVENKSYNKQLDKHIEQFSFLKEKGMFLEFYDREYYLNQLKQIKKQCELKQLRNDNNKRKKQFEQIVKPFNSYQQTILRTANKSVYFRSWRTEHLEQTADYLQNLFEEIAKRLGLDSKKEVVWLLPHEVEQLLLKEQKANKDLIQQRKQAFVYLTEENKEDIILQGKEAAEFFNKIKNNITNNKGNELNGMSAFPGKVTGKAVVIHSREGYNNIKNGEILIIHATSPEIVPYLTNIKAIVTEEGGILSHVAVISREMKIPAIIGTGNCTKLVKTGEIVEVNTENGTVKIITK